MWVLQKKAHDYLTNAAFCAFFCLTQYTRENNLYTSNANNFYLTEQEVKSLLDKNLDLLPKYSIIHI